MALQVGRASWITFRTLPYIMLRLLVYVLFALGFVIYFWMVFEIGQMLVKLHEYARVAVWVIALLLSFPITRLVREYVLYIIKAGHVAVITELVTKGKLPEGVGQIQWGKDQVMNTFKEVSVLFVMDRLVAGVIRSVNQMMRRIGSFFSAIPGMQGLMSFANLILNFSLTYIDEAIMARNFCMKNENVWESSKNGLILYAQSWKELVQAAILLSFASILSYGILFVIFLIPLWSLALAYPSFKLLFVIAAFLLAGAAKLALFDPWALTNMILVYLTVTEGKTPDSSWENKLESVSGKFKKIQQKAQQNV